MSPNSDGSADFLCICTHFGIYNKQDQASGASLEHVRRIEDFVQHAASNVKAAVLAEAQNIREVCATWEFFDSEPTRKIRKIDYISFRQLGKPGTHVWTMENTQKVVADKDNASDHRPLVATLQLSMSQHGEHIEAQQQARVPLLQPLVTLSSAPPPVPTAPPTAPLTPTACLPQQNPPSSSSSSSSSNRSSNSSSSPGHTKEVRCDWGA